jgi:hypothetical protein
MKLPVDYRRLTPTERAAVRREYVRRQDGKCYYCSAPLSQQPPKHITDKAIDLSLFPQNFLKYPVHLQHSHDTGMTEGAVHSYCNAVLWQYENR